MDGKLVPWADATVHVLTHGLHYGTGAFEGLRTYETDDGPAVFRLVDHIKRLELSTKALGIPFEYSIDTIVDACTEVVRVNNLSSCYIRPIVFFGTGAMGLNPAGADVHVAIAAWEWGAYLGDEGLEKGIRVAVSSWRRIGHEANMPNTKGTGAYINSVLAKTAAVRAGYDEAILLNTSGLVAEGSGENIFAVRDGILYTPPTAAGALGGITQDSVRTMLTDEGYEIRDFALSRTDLYYADELFFTGTASEITPIRSVDRLEIGGGGVGPITETLQKEYLGIATGERPDRYGWLEPIEHPASEVVL